MWDRRYARQHIVQRTQFSFRKSRFDAMSHICPLLTEHTRFVNDFMDESIYSIIQEVSPDFNNSVVDCDFKGMYRKPCSGALLPILTEEGVCFTFNALNSRDIYTDE